MTTQQRERMEQQIALWTRCKQTDCILPPLSWNLFEMIEFVDSLLAERDRLRAALQHIADCDELSAVAYYKKYPNGFNNLTTSEFASAALSARDAGEGEKGGSDGR